MDIILIVILSICSGSLATYVFLKKEINEKNLIIEENLKVIKIHNKDLACYIYLIQSIKEYITKNQKLLREHSRKSKSTEKFSHLFAGSYLALKNIEHKIETLEQEIEGTGNND